MLTPNLSGIVLSEPVPKILGTFHALWGNPYFKIATGDCSVD